MIGCVLIQFKTLGASSSDFILYGILIQWSVGVCFLRVPVLVISGLS